MKRRSGLDMIIKTDRLILEPLGTKHFPAACKYMTDPENARMMIFLPCENDKEVMDYLHKAYMQWEKGKPEYLDAAIILDGIHIGAVSIEFVNNGKTGELGWIIDRNYWGNGYTFEAAKSFMEYCREKYNLTHYIAHADSENRSSIRIMEKLGMTLVNIYSGRKNRISDEIRKEVMYELFI